MRSAEIKRTTAETDIYLDLTLDGEGEAQINTGCGILNHMLTLFAKHSGMDLDVSCKGDVEVDYHHTTEDIGICIKCCATPLISIGKSLPVASCSAINNAKPSLLTFSGATSI